MAIDKNGLIYFVDGTMIRKVDQNGIISTVLGSNDLTSARPLTCDTSMHISQVSQGLFFSQGLDWLYTDEYSIKLHLSYPLWQRRDKAVPFK